MGILNTTHIHQTKTEHIPYTKKVEINEYKAPTEESVKLLNEMQQKARKNIINTIVINDNLLNAVMVFYTEDIASGNVIYHIRFRLNGKDHLIESHITRSELGNDSTSIYGILFQRLSQAITKELIQENPQIINSINKVFNR